MLLFFNKFSSSKKIHFHHFSSSATHQFNHLVGCHATGINYLLFFSAFRSLNSIIPSYKSDMNNRIIFIKINIIKVNVIKIYTKNTHFITTNVTKLESSLTKIISSLENRSSSNFFNHFSCKEPIRNKF